MCGVTYVFDVGFPCIHSDVKVSNITLEIQQHRLGLSWDIVYMSKKEKSPGLLHNMSFLLLCRRSDGEAWANSFLFFHWIHVCHDTKTACWIPWHSHQSKVRVYWYRHLLHEFTSTVLQVTCLLVVAISHMQTILYYCKYTYCYYNVA